MSDENYNKMSAIILSGNPDFEQSEFYRDLVDSGMDDLPGVVLGRFGGFLVSNLGDEESVLSGFSTLEALVCSGDPDVREAVVNEIFEVRAEPVVVLECFYAQLGPRCQELYREACRPLPSMLP